MLGKALALVGLAKLLEDDYYEDDDDGDDA